ncbi:hypothetical protein SAMN06272765_7322 [Streptomyces sp. Ag109_G2-15]|nr:hypothetical protein SAMN06272765_7322 [Streptomyces sp. Ag109_G2-15]
MGSQGRLGCQSGHGRGSCSCSQLRFRVRARTPARLHARTRPVGVDAVPGGSDRIGGGGVCALALHEFPGRRPRAARRTTPSGSRLPVPPPRPSTPPRTTPTMTGRIVVSQERCEWFPLRWSPAATRRPDSEPAPADAGGGDRGQRVSDSRAASARAWSRRPRWGCVGSPPKGNSVTSEKQFKKDARALADQEGISYTDACWRLWKAPAAPADAVRYGWQQITVDALSAVVAEHGVGPVRVIWSEDTRRPTIAGRNTGQRWGVAEPAADGYVIREVAAPVGAVEKGARVPVPYRTAGWRSPHCGRWYGTPMTSRSGGSCTTAGPSRSPATSRTGWTRCARAPICPTRYAATPSRTGSSVKTTGAAHHAGGPRPGAPTSTRPASWPMPWSPTGRTPPSVRPEGTAGSCGPRSGSRSPRTGPSCPAGSTGPMPTPTGRRCRTCRSTPGRPDSPAPRPEPA